LAKYEGVAISRSFKTACAAVAVAAAGGRLFLLLLAGQESGKNACFRPLAAHLEEQANFCPRRAD